ncbi:MAG: hypothetical protein DRJ41_00460 [Thermoprotei archaeon]|nr:MAG: hypothetical protein DRJ41_00460 [Thermoprotei archaeon]
MITIREDSESIKNWLKSLGFTERESQIIYFLMENGSSSVSEIVKGTGIARPHVYTTLKTLSLRGLVSKSQDRPAKYALSGIVGYLKERVSRQLEVNKRMLKVIETFLPKEQGVTRIHEERKSFLESLMYSLENSQIKFWTVIPYTYVIEELSVKRILSIRSKGIEVRVATSEVDLLKKFLEAPSFVRLIEPPPPFFLAIVDNRVFLSPIIRDKLTYGIESDEENVVKNFERYFNHIWSDDYIVTLNKLRMTTPKEY